MSMTLPENFGLSPVATLAHVGDPTRPPWFAPFWKTWNAAAWSINPRLEQPITRDADPSDPTATHRFTGIRHVRIGCLLVMPPSGRPAAGLVTMHGYGGVPPLEDEAKRWRASAAKGLATLLVRVRGYPGSQVDTGDWTATPTGYVARGLESAITEHGCGCEWSVSYAVADTLAACRVMRTMLGPDRPLYLHGHSFGAALALITASQLAERDPVARLAIGLPSLGDWPWRLAHPIPGGTGAGAEIRRFLADHPELHDQTCRLLRAFDTVLHARRTACPVLCKLALRDDVVPAPSAAAVFNALGTDPGMKWRFLARCGHADAGIADARRHALFARCVDDFLDPAQTPMESMARCERPAPEGPDARHATAT
jgi:cephalosporin-C deacetylase-like acetyl esterase